MTPANVQGRRTPLLRVLQRTGQRDDPVDREPVPKLYRRVPEDWLGDLFDDRGPYRTPHRVGRPKYGVEESDKIARIRTVIVLVIALSRRTSATTG